MAHRGDLGRDRHRRGVVSAGSRPWLNAFRLTIAGALLLGRIFSPWDMLAYGAGIGLGILLDRLATSGFRTALRVDAGTR
jgi:hypothetical protein